MAKKLILNPEDRNDLTDILTSLTERAIKKMQTGQIDGRPVTQKDFAIINKARATIKRRGQPPDK